jgi:CheY-like chemotaxis protein
VCLADSREAAQRVEAEKFDAAFVDVRMPGMDGFELTRRARASLRLAYRNTNLVPIEKRMGIRGLRRPALLGLAAVLLGVNGFLTSEGATWRF